MQETVKAFADEFQFTDIKQDDNSNLYSLTNPVNQDNLSFDCSYNTLELSFGKEENINILSKRFRNYFSFLQDKLHPAGHLLTGMGINPHYQYHVHEPIANKRYRMLYRYLNSYQKYDTDMKYHDIPYFGMMAAASQVQLDVGKDQIIQSLMTFNRLEPFKAILFANSLFDRRPELVISRDWLWNRSAQGYNPHNLDMYGVELHSIDEYIEYVKTQSMYCVGKEDKYFHFRPMPLTKYFSAESVTGEYFDGETWKTGTFRPEIEDLAHLRTFKFEDLTYRGTIEYRSACEQPVRDAFTHAAFHVGLAQKLDELTQLLNQDVVLYGHGYRAEELRKLFTYKDLPDFVDRKALSARLIQILQLAEAGLFQRGFGEEFFLKPLFDRAERLTNPALAIAKGLANGDSPETWAENYALITP